MATERSIYKNSFSSGVRRFVSSSRITVAMRVNSVVGGVDVWHAVGMTANDRSTSSMTRHMLQCASLLVHIGYILYISYCMQQHVPYVRNDILFCICTHIIALPLPAHALDACARYMCQEV